MVTQLTDRPPTAWHSKSVVGFAVRRASRRGHGGAVLVEPGVTNTHTLGTIKSLIFLSMKLPIEVEIA